MCVPQLSVNQAGVSTWFALYKYNEWQIYMGAPTPNASPKQGQTELAHDV